MSTKDYWLNIDNHLDKLQVIWDDYVSEEYTIDKNTDTYQKVLKIWLLFYKFSDIISGKSKALWPLQQDEE